MVLCVILHLHNFFKDFTAQLSTNVSFLVEEAQQIKSIFLNLDNDRLSQDILSPNELAEIIVEKNSQLKLIGRKVAINLYDGYSKIPVSRLWHPTKKYVV